jgi:hypothetical protein
MVERLLRDQYGFISKAKCIYLQHSQVNTLAVRIIFESGWTPNPILWASAIDNVEVNIDRRQHAILERVFMANLWVTFGLGVDTN